MTLLDLHKTIFFTCEWGIDSLGKFLSPRSPAFITPAPGFLTPCAAPGAELVVRVVSDI